MVKPKKTRLKEPFSSMEQKRSRKNEKERKEQDRIRLNKSFHGKINIEGSHKNRRFLWIIPLILVLGIFIYIISVNADTPPQTSNGNLILVTNGGNFTINASSGLLVSIVDKNTGLELMNQTYGGGSGLIFYNGSTNYLTTTQPSNVKSHFLINNSREIKVEQDNSIANFNITYDYQISDNNDSLIINISLKKIRIVFDANISVFQYMLDFNRNILNQSNITPYDDDLTDSIGSGFKGITFTKNSQDYGGFDWIYIFNQSYGLMFTITNPLSNSLPGNRCDGFCNHFRLWFNNIPLFYKSQNPYFNNLIPQFESKIILTLSKDIEDAKRKTFNQSYPPKKEYQGSWMILCGSGATITDKQLQDAYKAGTRFVEIGCWNDGTGLYYMDENWKTPFQSNVNNRTFINTLINRINSNNMSSFLYFDTAALNETTANKYFQSDILMNSSFSQQNLALTNRSKMTFDNQSSWFYNTTDQVKFLLTTYQNLTGIFLDENYFRDLDYNTTKPIFIDGVLNITYTSIMINYEQFLKNISYTIHNVYNKSLILNNPSSAVYTQYADAISDDSDVLSHIFRIKLISLGKPFYFSPVSTTNDFIYYRNFSILWGVYPEYDESGKKNYSSSDFYLINKTANARLIRYSNKGEYVEYDTLLTSQSNNWSYKDYDNNNFDYYFLNNHTIQARDTNTFYWNQSGNITNVIWKGNLSDYPYYWKNQIFGVRDTNQSVIDFINQGELINNTLSQDINISFEGLIKPLIYYQNNSILCANINNCNDNINLTLQPNNYTHILDNFNLTEGITRANSPLWFSSITSNSRKIASNLTDTINATITISVSDNPSSIIYTSHTGTYKKTYTQSDWAYDNAAKTITFTLNGIEPATSSNELVIITGGTTGSAGAGSTLPPYNNTSPLILTNQTNQSVIPIEPEKPLDKIIEPIKEIIKDIKESTPETVKTFLTEQKVILLLIAASLLYLGVIQRKIKKKKIAILPAILSGVLFITVFKPETSLYLTSEFPKLINGFIHKFLPGITITTALIVLIVLFLIGTSLIMSLKKKRLA